MVKPITYTLSTKDYDQTTMAANGVTYADQNGHTYGYQMLGAATFWVPRSIWPSKPIDTGASSVEPFREPGPRISPRLFGSRRGWTSRCWVSLRCFCSWCPRTSPGRQLRPPGHEDQCPTDVGAGTTALPRRLLVDRSSRTVVTGVGQPGGHTGDLSRSVPVDIGREIRLRERRGRTSGRIHIAARGSSRRRLRVDLLPHVGCAHP